MICNGSFRFCIADCPPPLQIAVTYSQAKVVQECGAARRGITHTNCGIAGIKAVILAKFMLVRRMLHIGERFRDNPLIWPTLHYALMTLIALLILTTAEEAVLVEPNGGRRYA